MNKVTNEFLLAALNEIQSSGACNAVGGMAEAIYRIKEENAREFLESFTCEDIEETDAYKNTQLKYDVLVSVAHALDIGYNRDRDFRISKINELIGDLNKIKMAL